MPLHNKEEFIKEPTPVDIKPNDLVYYCSQTDEIFTEYDKFYSRIILCNALVWTCSYSGKSGLTFSEAEESERKCLQLINNMDGVLKKVLVYLASLTNHQRFGEVVEDVFNFVKDRYFIKEQAWSMSSNQKKKCKILSVKSPANDLIKLKNEEKIIINGIDKRDVIVISDTEDECKLMSNPEKNIPILNNDYKSLPPRKYKYEIQEIGSKKTTLVRFDRLCRSKSELSREKVKLILKCSCRLTSSGFWSVKNSAMKKYGIVLMKWKDIFDGPMPHFAKPYENHEIIKLKNKKNMENMSLAELKDQINKKEKKLKQMKLNKDQFKEDKNREEARKHKIMRDVLLKEWAKTRDDLQCEDLEPLPLSKPIVLPYGVPSNCLGDIFNILSFCTVMGKSLDIKNSLSETLTIETLCKSLISNNIESLFMEILVMFLRHILPIHEDISIEDVNKNLTDLHSDEDYGSDEDDEFELMITKRAEKLPLLNYNSSLQSLQLDTFSASEILRLHLMASGSGRKGKYDSCLSLRKNDPSIIKNLSTQCINEFSPEIKLKLLSALSQQLLEIYKDVIDERINAARELNSQIIRLKRTQGRRERSEQSYKNEKLKQCENDAGVKVENVENDNIHEVSSNRQMRSKAKNIEKNTVANLLDQDPDEIDWSKVTDEAKLAMQQAYNSQIVDLQRQLLKIQDEIMVTPIGIDRTYRKYWFLSYIYGIVIEDDPDIDIPASLWEVVDQVGPPIEIKKQREKNDIVKSKTDLHKNISKTDIKTAIAEKGKNLWTVYNRPEEIDFLIYSLNSRGFRESSLKSTLIKLRDKIVLNENCWNPDKEIVTIQNVENIKIENNIDESKTSASSTEEYLIEAILDLEDRLYASQLGNLKVNDRDIWRNKLLQNNYDPQSNTLEWYNCDEELAKKIIEGENLSSVNSLSAAILQLAQAVESKFLKPPLGDDDEIRLAKQKAALEAVFKGTLNSPLKAIKKGAFEEKVGHPFERWQSQLMQSTSLSQLFVSLNVLESSVIWEKSVLRARCKICKRKGNAEQMLLCDGCDRGHHMYCLKPAVKKIPEGNWYCQSCKPKDLPTPRKRIEHVKEYSDDEDDYDDSQNGDEIENGELSNIENGESDFEPTKEKKSKKHIIKLRPLQKKNAAKQVSSREETPESFRSSSRNKQKKNSTSPPAKIISKGSKRSIRPIGNLGDKKPEKRKRSQTEEIDGGSKKISKRAKVSENHSLSPRTSKRRNRTSSDLNKFRELIYDLTNLEDSWPFLEPINIKHVPDYFDVIKKPIDLQSMKYKLSSLEYDDAQDIISDLKLMLNNCFEYNKIKSDVYKCGKSVEKWLQSRLVSMDFSL